MPASWSAPGRGVLSWQSVVLACGGCDAPESGFKGGRFSVPYMGGKVTSDAVLVDWRRALQRLLATGREHDEQAAAIPGRRSSLHESSLLDPIDQPRQAAFTE